MNLLGPKMLWWTRPRQGLTADEGAETVTFLLLVKKGRNYLIYHSISYHIHSYDDQMTLEFAAFQKGIITTWKIKLVKYIYMKNNKADRARLSGLEHLLLLEVS